MTEGTAHTIERALLALSERCDGAHSDDGQGFNGRDAKFGNSLADQLRAGRRLTANQRTSAYRMLGTYRVQLGKLGVDYGEIAAPIAALDQERVASLLREQHAIKIEDIVLSGPHDDDDDVSELPEGQISARAVLGPGGIIAQQLAGYESREAQLMMAARVEQAIQNEEPAVIEAGTGTGKSLGYLVPAILSKQTTVVSTADKALQEQIWQKDIPFLKSVLPVDFEAVLMKGIGNYVCRYELTQTTENLAGDMFGPGDGFSSERSAAQWLPLLDWVSTTDSGDLDSAPFMLAPDVRRMITIDSDGCLGEKCPSFGSCYYQQMRARAKRADVIVVNHALLMRDLEIRFRTEGHASIIPTPDVIVLDEAHHLEDVATDAFGDEATEGRWMQLSRQLANLTTGHRALKSANADPADQALATRWEKRSEALSAGITTVFDILLTRMRAPGQRKKALKLGDETTIATGLPEALALFGRAVQSEAPPWLDEPQRERWDKLGKSIDTYGGQLAAALFPPENPYETVRYMEIEGTIQRPRLVLHSKPVEIAPRLRSRLWNAFPCTISTSATIATDSGMSYWRKRVGLDAGTDLILPAPFDYAHASLLYLPPNGEQFDSSRYRQEGSIEYLDRLAAEIEQLLLAAKGRAFVLFTSFSVLDEVHRRLSPRLTYTVLKQGDAPRGELVRQFKSDGHAVLFGVKSFWEGVDVQGEALSLVIIDKLPFVPPDDPVWEAKCEAVNRRTGDKWGWWNELAIPYAVIALKQGFGRLIRHREDRGVVALLDGRLTSKPYGARIVRALPPATPTRSLDAVRAFLR